MNNTGVFPFLQKEKKKRKTGTLSSSIKLIEYISVNCHHIKIHSVLATIQMYVYIILYFNFEILSLI